MRQSLGSNSPLVTRGSYQFPTYGLAGVVKNKFLPREAKPVRKYIETNGNLSQDMTLTEAENWLKGFTAWFKWNALILDNKCPVTKAALLVSR